MNQAMKGYIKNVETGIVKSFMYNPTSFGDSHGVNYSEIKSPGGSYPKFQYVSGVAKKFSIDLFLFDKTGANKVREFVAFLNDFLPVAKQGVRFKKPPLMIFAYGWYVKSCILDDISVDYQEFDSLLNPVKAVVKLNMRAVS